MKKLKGELSLDKHIDPCLFAELVEGEEDFQNTNYYDFALRGCCIKKYDAKEYKRDFSFLIIKRVFVYMTHKETKKNYRVAYTYKANFKADGYSIKNVEVVPEKVIQDFEEIYKEDSLIKLSEIDYDGLLNIYIKNIEENEEYEICEYSYFLKNVTGTYY